MKETGVVNILGEQTLSTVVPFQTSAGVQIIPKSQCILNTERKMFEVRHAMMKSASHNSPLTNSSSICVAICNYMLTPLESLHRVYVGSVSDVPECLVLHLQDRCE
jgi:hypothetical protein